MARIGVVRRMGVGRGDDRARLVLVAVEIGDLLLEILEIGPELDIVNAGLERALHEPGLESRPRHQAERLRGEDPFEVRRHLVALDRNHVAVLHLLVRRQERLRRKLIDGVHIADVVARMVVEALDEAPPHARMAGARPTPDRRLRLVGKGEAIGEAREMPERVELHHDGIGVLARDRAALHDGRAFRNEGDVAEGIVEQQVGGEGLRILLQVVIIEAAILQRDLGVPPRAGDGRIRAELVAVIDPRDDMGGHVGRPQVREEAAAAGGEERMRDGVADDAAEIEIDAPQLALQIEYPIAAAHRQTVP